MPAPRGEIWGKIKEKYDLPDAVFLSPHYIVTLPPNWTVKKDKDEEYEDDFNIIDEEGNIVGSIWMTNKLGFTKFKKEILFS